MAGTELADLNVTDVPMELYMVGLQRENSEFLRWIFGLRPPRTSTDNCS